MSKTESQKKLTHKIRQGLKIDPRAMRGSWNGVKPITKVKPNKKKEDMSNEADVS
jgi:hypothetical protein